MQAKQTIDIKVENPIGSTINAWAKIRQDPNPTEKLDLIETIKQELVKQKAVLVAHYYVNPDIQDLALATGGCVADSLEMARFGRDHTADTLIVAGVKFMGETAKILSPNKRILVPELEANCSLDLGCPAQEFAQFRSQYPDHTVVVYANTSAEVKAQADWMVTSSIALPIVNHLKNEGKKILWAPDKHLGSYIQSQTQADMVLWKGSCIVHDEFKSLELENLKKQYPEAKVLVHPESPAEVVRLADVVGSTSAILRAAKELPNSVFIVATDNGMMHSLRQQNPHKLFLEAPTAGESATCKSCAHCPWMAMNDLYSLHNSLTKGSYEINLPEDVRKKALIPINRMLEFASQNPHVLNQNAIPSNISLGTGHA